MMRMTGVERSSKFQTAAQRMQQPMTPSGTMSHRQVHQLRRVALGSICHGEGVHMLLQLPPIRFKLHCHGRTKLAAAQFAAQRQVAAAAGGQTASSHPKTCFGI
jgi:hypothetical protein